MALPQEPITILLFGVFGLAILVQLYYYLRYFTGIFKKLPTPQSSKEPVSVVICTRNNREGLEANLQSVLDQEYPDFEVVVVNDGSTDGTIAFLDELEKHNQKLKVLHLDIDERFHRGKKFAQTIGIKGAKNNLLLFTDSDCKPESNQWLRKMASRFSDKTQIILGIGRYERKAGLTNWIVQLETFHTALLYINFAIRNKPYMGVGRNLAYKRDLFFSVKGFASHQHIMSGDDDLFVNETSTATNTAVCLEEGSHTLSVIKGGLSNWIRQKKRHYSTGRAYRTADKLRLTSYYFSLFFMYAAFAATLITSPSHWILILSAFGLRFLIQGVILYKNTARLGYKPYFWVYPFLDIGILLIQIFVGIRGYFHKPKSW